mgnify:CR=1 FL=1
MIELLGLLLAGLVDGAVAGQRQARLYELVGRLGAQRSKDAKEEEDAEKTPLEKRLDWCWAFLGEAGNQYTFLLLVLRLPDSPIQVSPFAFNVRARNFDQEGLGVEVSIVLPDQLRGMVVPPPLSWRAEQSAWEPLLPWMARELMRGFDAKYREMGRYPFLPYLIAAVENVGLLDWFEAVHPDLTRMTAADALHATREWHAQFAAVRQVTGALSGVVVARTSDGGTIERLVTKDQLIAEGKTMGHCIGGSYDPKKNVYLSYRGPEGVSVETSEVDTSSQNAPVVVQRVGPNNDDGSTESPLASYLDSIVGAGEAEWGRRNGSPIVLPDLAVTAHRMARFTERLQTSVTALLKTLPGEKLWGYHDDRWATQAHVGRARRFVTMEAQAWATAFAQETQVFAFPGGEAYVLGRSSNSWPAVLLYRKDTDLPHGLRLVQSGDGTIGFSDDIHPPDMDPLRLFHAIGDVIEVGEQDVYEQHLRERYQAYVWQVGELPFSRKEALLPWRAFVALALERGAWPQGQHVPRGAR